MVEYAFGAGGFKLGDRVEVLMTGQRGILICEIVHVSGCNTYQVLLPNVLLEGRMRTTHRDYLMLRKLDPGESLFDGAEELADENSFSPKGVDVNAEWIRAAVSDGKEFITEVDDAVGIEEIAILPGTEVWNKVYGKTMVISHICRDIFSKELDYGAVYMADDKEITAFSRAYALIPLEQKFDLPPTGKHGSIFDDGRDSIIFRNRLFADLLSSI